MVLEPSLVRAGQDSSMEKTESLGDTNQLGPWYHYWNSSLQVGCMLSPRCSVSLYESPALPTPSYPYAQPALLSTLGRHKKTIYIFLISHTHLNTSILYGFLVVFLLELLVQSCDKQTASSQCLAQLLLNLGSQERRIVGVCLCGREERRVLKIDETCSMSFCYFSYTTQVRLFDIDRKNIAILYRLNT